MNMNDVTARLQLELAYQTLEAYGIQAPREMTVAAGIHALAARLCASAVSRERVKPIAYAAVKRHTLGLVK